MRVYADKLHLPAALPHCAMLYPFWGLAMKPEVERLYGSAFGRYLSRGAGLFELTPLREAQAAGLPFQWEQIMTEAVATRLDLALWGEVGAAARRTISEARRAAEASSSSRRSGELRTY